MKYSLYVIVFILVKFLTANEIINIAASIANKLYTVQYSTSVVWDQKDMDLVDMFLKQYNGTVVTIDINNTNFNNNTMFHETVLYQQTIFFCNDPNHFEYYLECVNSVIIVPIKVILILTHSEKYYVENITKIAWKNDVSNILILSEDSMGKVRLSTYFPYDGRVCGSHAPTDLNLSSDISFMRKYKDFHKCAVRVTLLEYIPFVRLVKVNGTITRIGGIDGRMLTLLFETLNFSIDIVSSDDHGGLDNNINGTRIGSFSDLLHNKADIMVPALIMNTLRYPFAQTTHVYNKLNMIWVLPKRREIYEWAKIFLPFFNMSTPFIIAAFLLLFIAMKIVIRFSNIKNGHHNKTALNLFGMFFGQNINYDLVNWAINSLYIFWIWFSMIVNITYQGKLVEGLRKSILEPKITSLKQAVNSVDSVGGTSAVLEFYRNTSLERKFAHVKLKDIPVFIKDIAAGKRYLLAVDTYQILFYRRDVQVIQHRVSNLATCIHMRPRWPAATEISLVISYLVEAGFYVKIKRDVLFNYHLRFGFKVDNKHTIEPLRFETLQSCFYGLFFMHMVSLVVLVIEILWNKAKI